MTTNALKAIRYRAEAETMREVARQLSWKHEQDELLRQAETREKIAQTLEKKSVATSDERRGWGAPNVGASLRPLSHEHAELANAQSQRNGIFLVAPSHPSIVRAQENSDKT